MQGGCPVGEEVVQKLRFEADIADIKTSLQELKDGLQGTAEKAAEHGVIYQKMFEAAQVGAKAVLEFYKQGVQAAIEYESATLRLGAALEATGQGRDRVAELQAQASALEKLTGIEEEQILTVQKLALNYGVTVDNMDRAMKAAASLSAVTGQDLASSFETLARIQETGVVPRTLQAMDAFKGLSAEQLRDIDIIDRVNEKLGSQMTAAMEGAEGAVFRLKDAFGDWGRDLATSVLPYLTDIFDKLTSIVSFVSKGGIGEGLAAAIYGTDISPEMMKAAGMYAGQMALVDPNNPSGAPSGKGRAFGPRGRKGSGKGIEFDFTEGSDEMVMTPDGTMMPKDEYEDMLASATKSIKDLDAVAEADREARQANADKILELERIKEEGLTEIAQDNAAIRGELLLAEQKKQSETYTAMGDVAQVVFQGMANSALASLEGWAAGQPVYLDKIASDMLKTIGKQVFGMGVVDEIEGAARIIRSYGADVTGWELAAIGAGEMVLGAGLMAGGAHLGAHLQPGAGGGGSSVGGGNVMRGGGGTSAFSGGSVGTSSGPASGGDKNITININGPSLNSPQMGVEIRNALKAAAKVGV